MKSFHCASKELQSFWNSSHLKCCALMWIVICSWARSIVFIILIIVVIIVILLNSWMRLGWQPILLVFSFISFSGYFWNENTTWFVLVNRENVNFFCIVVTWTWNFLFEIRSSRYWFFIGLWQVPLGAFARLTNRLNYFIFTRPNCVHLHSCVHFVTVLLLY